MPRPTWEPATDEQRDALAAIEHAAAEARRAEADVWAKVEAARKVGVPMSHAVKRTGRGRATAYRHRPE